MAPLRYPGLLSTQDDLAVRAGGAGLHRTRVRTGLWLGDGDRHDAVPVRDPLQIPLFQIVVPEFGDDLRRSHRRPRENVCGVRADPADRFLCEDDLEGSVSAAVLLWQGDTQQVVFRKDVDVLLGEFPIPSERVARELLLSDLLDYAFDEFLFLCEFEIHWLSCLAFWRGSEGTAATALVAFPLSPTTERAYILSTRSSCPRLSAPGTFRLRSRPGPVASRRSRTG